MARPTKDGLDYFPLDVDFFEDEKMLAISGEFAVKGEIITLRLLCEIYRNGYFVEYSELLKNKLARLSGLSSNLIDEVVGKLVKYGFFNESVFREHSVLTSKGIQKRYLEAVKRRKNYSCEHYWLLKEVNVYINPKSKDINVNISTQSKVKESKVNKIKEVVEEKGPLQPHVVGELVEASKIRVYKLDALETELKNSLMWKETIAIHNKISMEMVNTKISEFIEHLKLQGEEIKTLSDSKKHFNSWLRIMISKPNSDSKSKIVYDNPDLPPDNSGKWKWINGAWRDTTTFTTSQKRRHGLLPSG